MILCCIVYTIPYVGAVGRRLLWRMPVDSVRAHRLLSLAKCHREREQGVTTALVKFEAWWSKSSRGRETFFFCLWPYKWIWSNWYTVDTPFLGLVTLVGIFMGLWCTRLGHTDQCLAILGFAFVCVSTKKEGFVDRDFGLVPRRAWAMFGLFWTHVGILAAW